MSSELVINALQEKLNYYVNLKCFSAWATKNFQVDHREQMQAAYANFRESMLELSGLGIPEIKAAIIVLPKEVYAGGKNKGARRDGTYNNIVRAFTLVASIFKCKLVMPKKHDSNDYKVNNDLRSRIGKIRKKAEKYGKEYFKKMLAAELGVKK